MIILSKCPVCGNEMRKYKISSVSEGKGNIRYIDESGEIYHCDSSTSSCKSTFTKDLHLISYHGHLLLPLTDPFAREIKKERNVSQATSDQDLFEKLARKMAEDRKKKRKTQEEQFAEFLSRWKRSK